MSQTKTFSTKLDKLLAQLPYLPQAFALVWAAARRWTVAWAIMLVLQGLLPVATVYLTRALVDSLVASVEAGGSWQELRPTLILVALMAAIMLLLELLRSVTSWVRTAQSELVQDHISHLIHHQAISLDLGFYEAPDYYDRLHRARIDAFNRPVALLENMGSLLQNGLTLIAMAGVLIPFGWWVPLVLLFSTFPALVVVVRYTLRENEWRLRTTPDKRRTHYYDWLLTERNTAAELRLFALGDYWKAAFQSLRQRLRTERVELARQQALAELGAGGLTLLTTAFVIAFQLWRTVQGQLTLGDLALFYQAFNQGQRLMRTLLGSVGQIYSNMLFLENLFEFLAIEAQMSDPAQPKAAPPALQEGIRFHDVTFRYPGSERVALENSNFTIPASKITALVGVNGAGKSTLTKLICRFYDPESGYITLDGVDLRHFAQDELRRLITILFQQPVQYHTTAAENIALGDLSAQPTPADIERAAQAAGAEAPIKRLPQKYETVLGKWFGGAELSGGEWQRVALARAFLRQAPIIILDEPTSAMDSWAEADWLARFRTLTAGRTAIIITHRFTTAMQADVIHVMDVGQIIESGSHEELLTLGGRYAQSWRAQMNGKFADSNGTRIK